MRSCMVGSRASGPSRCRRYSHLSQLFRKATGATMLNWRRENRETPDE